jgi:hypothetical protein
MKPRLASAPRTIEDMLLSARWPRDFKLNVALHDVQVESDRRDAELMHAWTHVLHVDGDFRGCNTCKRVVKNPGAGIVSLRL